MIKCNFTDNGFSVSGHSGYSEIGTDIVCAAVSGMVMLVCNTITEKTPSTAVVSVDEESGTVILNHNNTSKDEFANILINSLMDELVNLSKEYPDNLQVFRRE